MTFSIMEEKRKTVIVKSGFQAKGTPLGKTFYLTPHVYKKKKKNRYPVNKVVEAYAKVEEI